MITKEQAEKLSHGTVIHDNRFKSSDGTCKRWRVNGKIKTWKTNPARFSIPIKHGFRGPYNYLTEESCSEFHLAIDCPALNPA